MKKIAVLQVADTGPLESIALMFKAIGWEVRLPNARFRQYLRDIGCDTVLDIKGLVESWGYENPFPIDPIDKSQLVEIIVKGQTRVIFVDIKGHRSYEKIVSQIPYLKDRILWYRINGGEPEHVVNSRGDHGDEINPPCPVLTPNQWYSQRVTPKGERLICYEKAYSCWPPFFRFSEYERVDNSESPLCLIHNLKGWGYGELGLSLRKHGVKCFGGNSPDGLISHVQVKEKLKRAIAMVHLKSSDAPGYAIYECLASGCPLICSRRLIWRCKMQELLIPNETCLVYDRETHDGLSQKDIEECTHEIVSHLENLKNPAYNQKIGQQGKERLHKIMWSPYSPTDLGSFKRFIDTYFP